MTLLTSSFKTTNFSKRGVIRGLHLQLKPYVQAKLIRVLQGEILDVVVDLRHDSDTYGESFSMILSAENQKQLMVPHGCAHGFSVLSETASVLYKVDQLYHKESEKVYGMMMLLLILTGG
jgi:dTDP-4-dehydrorhamnose 3,5-epimerase